MSEKNEVICLKGDCPDNKNLYVEETKECVSSCIGTGSEVYFNKTCIKNCEGKTGREMVESKNDPFIKLISKYYCRCSKMWYIDINGYDICVNDDNIKSCSDIKDFNFKYNISSNKQCVNSCPDDYFSFNDQCLLDCGEQHYKDVNLKMCISHMILKEIF